MCQNWACDLVLHHFFHKKHSEHELEKRPWQWIQMEALESEVATVNSCITRRRKDIWLSALHLTTNGLHLYDSYIASFYFRILISESRVSDSSCLGKAGVAPGFVVLSDIVFRNNSQQGRLEEDYSVMGNGAICPTTFPVLHRILAVEMKYEPLWQNEEISGCCLDMKSRCYFVNPKSPFSSPTSVLCVSHFWRAVMYCICEYVSHIFGSNSECLKHVGMREWKCWGLSLFFAECKPN